MPEETKQEQTQTPPQTAINIEPDSKLTAQQWDDKTKASAEKWNKAKESGKNALLADLKEKTGIDDIEALAEIVKNFNDGVEKDQKAVDEYKTENQKLVDQIKTLENQGVVMDIDNRVVSAITAGQKVHNINSVKRDFLSDFQIKMEKGSEIVYNHGKEIPIMKDNRPATIAEVITEWAKVDKNKHQFIGAADSHLETGGAPITQNDTDRMTNPKYVNALRMSGQLNKYLMGEKINEKAVDDLMKKNNQLAAL